MERTETSSGDDFLDQIFDPKFKELFKEKFDSLGDVVIERDFKVPIDFKGDIGAKAQKVLKNLVTRVFKIAESFGMHLSDSNPKVIFFSINAWKKSSPKNPQVHNLPAAKIAWETQNPTIQLITPNNTQSSEIIIKTVRLLISKLFGKLYFDEIVLVREPYKAKNRKKEILDFSRKEKAEYCKAIDHIPKEMLEHIYEFGKGMRGNKEKVKEQAKSKFFKQFWNEESELPGIETHVLDTCFENLKNKAGENIDAFFDLNIDSVNHKAPQIGLILPHELKQFRYLESKREWAIFNALEEKLVYINNALKDLKESVDYIQEVTDSVVTEYASSDYWKRVLNDRISFLKRKGLVKLFLIDAAKLSPNQHQERLQFPLWIWRQRLFENYPPTKNTNKIIQLITSQYENSVYQKLFEAAFRATNCLNMLGGEKRINFENFVDFKRLRAIMSWFEFRESIFGELLSVCRIGGQLHQFFDGEEENHDLEIKNFEEAWAYFVSFALIHQYYLNQGDEYRQKSDKFISIIENHVQAKLEKSSSFQISRLLLDIYKKSSYDLRQSIELIKEPGSTLDFFILNQKRIMMKDAAKDEIIGGYVEKLLERDSA